jgi:hypothetical protein
MISDELSQEITRGEGETLSRLALRVPRTREDKQVTLGCVLRWVLKGAKAQGSPDRVRLEAVRLGGRWISTPGALLRFIEAQTPGDKRRALPRSPTRRRRASQRAAKALGAAGI